MSQANVSGVAWNVAIFCADPAGGEDAERQVKDTLATLGLQVRCHMRRWRFAELSALSVFESAVDDARDADLVVLSGHESGPMSEGLQAVLAEWLIRCGFDASPLAVALNCDASGENVHDEIFRLLRRLTDQGHVPLYTDFRDALVVAWDLWEWKHFPWERASEEPFVESGIHPFPVRQRATARPCLGASPSAACAGTGGIGRQALTASRQACTARRCQH